MDPTVFIAVTTAAVVLQAGILVALYLSVRKTSSRMEALATEVKTKVLPTAEMVHSMLLEWRPKVETTLSDVSESTTLIRGQIERLDSTLTDVIDRTRLQVIRADELVSQTMDRVEEATDMVHKTVISPVRKVSGVVQGVTAGLEFLLGQKRRRREPSVAQDEMFI
jgi:hypothetical protein